MKNKIAILVISLIAILTPLLSVSAATAAVKVSLPWTYTFGSSGTLNQTVSADTSGSAYWWVANGGQLLVSNGVGKTMQGDATSANPWYTIYAKSLAVTSDNGKHPQNTFAALLRTPTLDTDQSIAVQINKDNLANTANRKPYNGIHLISRWQNDGNYYFAGLRADGHAVIKKKVGNAYYTLAEKSAFPGTYNSTTNPNLLPKNTWMNVRMITSTDASGSVHVQLYLNQTLMLDTTDNGARGATIKTEGLTGIRSDFMDMLMDNYKLSVPAINKEIISYDSAILASKPVMYLSMATPSSATEKDLTGNGHDGTYKGGSPATATLPNGDSAAAFNGSSQYLSVPSSSAFSVSTTRQLTWEAWIRPDTLQFPNDSGYGYVDWMGKCQDYGPTCEWEARMYNATNPEGRTNRLSAYVFNPTAGLGSGADWQPISGLIQAGKWIHVVGEYQTITTPDGCSTISPGSINIWVDGVKWNMASHFPTGCMSQFKVTPTANNSPLNIGTMTMDTWFKGAIGKVAIYDRLLTETEIQNHFQAMTGKLSSGSCAITCTASTVQ